MGQANCDPTKNGGGATDRVGRGTNCFGVVLPWELEVLAMLKVAKGVRGNFKTGAWGAIHK